MRIGELARLAEVNVQTIRFYEREGLLRAPNRSAAGYRCYSLRDLRVVQNIRALQAVGFTLKDIVDLAECEKVLSTDGLSPALKSSARSQILRRAEDRLSALNTRLRDLSRMKAEMEQLIEAVTESGAHRGFVLPTEVVSVSRKAASISKSCSMRGAV
jgi:MerR family copper efflux transcriptional regulator